MILVFHPRTHLFFRLKASREEQILEAEFGAGYIAYRANTGSILPRIAHV